MGLWAVIGWLMGAIMTLVTTYLTGLLKLEHL